MYNLKIYFYLAKIYILYEYSIINYMLIFVSYTKNIYLRIFTKFGNILLNFKFQIKNHIILKIERNIPRVFRECMTCEKLEFIK